MMEDISRKNLSFDCLSYSLYPKHIRHIRSHRLLQIVELWTLEVHCPYAEEVQKQFQYTHFRQCYAAQQIQ